MMSPLEGRPGRQSSSEAEGFCANKSPYFTFWAFEEVWLKTFIYKFICRISFHSCCLPVSCTVDSYFLVKYRYWIGRDMKSYENKRTNDSREEHTIVECIYFKLWAYWLGIIWNFRFKFSWVQCSHWTFFLVAFTPKAPKKSVPMPYHYIRDETLLCNRASLLMLPILVQSCFKYFDILPYYFLWQGVSRLYRSNCKTVSSYVQSWWLCTEFYNVILRLCSWFTLSFLTFLLGMI